MAYYIGKTGFVTISPSAGGAAVRLPLSEWSLETENDKVDFSNFESSGAKSIAGGFFGGRVSASGPYESGAITSSSILTDFRSGKIVQAKLGLLQTGTLGFAVYILIDSVNAGMDAKEKGTFEFTGELTNMDNTLVIQATQNASLVPA